MKRINGRTIAYLSVFLVVIARSTFAVTIQALPAEPLHYSVADLHEDVNFVSRSLTQIHFSLGDETWAANIKSQAEQIKNSVKAPLTQAEFYVVIAPLITAMRDGHTSIPFPFRDIDNYAASGGKIFPLDVTHIQDGLFVLSDISSGQKIPLGARLLAINDVPIEKILTQMQSLLSGDRAEYRLAQLDGINDRFKVLLWMLYGSCDEYAIRYNINGEAREGKVSALTREQVRAERKKHNPPKFEPYEFQLLEPGVAELKIRSFVVDQKVFEKFLQASFKKIEQSNISRLIIDVRGNLGGDLDLATGLLSYVATEPVAIIARTELRVSQQAKADFALKIPTALRWLPVQYLDSKGREVWGAAEGSLVSFSEKPGNKKQGAASAAGLRFTGKVIVLVDAISTSAAEYFADAVQRNKLGTVIGQAAGNAPNIWYGEPLLVKMPYTELGFTVSRMAFYPPAIESISTPGHLVPDFSVARNLADELARQDTILSFALKQP